MKGSLLAVGLAAAAAQSVLTLKSPTDSQVAFGGAVINSYCQANVPPKFVAADLVGDPTHPDGTSLLPGTDHSVKLTLQDVKVSCLGNKGVEPCATDAGAAEPRDAQFVCMFSSPGHDDVRSTAVQAVRIIETWRGTTSVAAEVICEMPGRVNTNHTVTVGLEFNGKATVPLSYTGSAGGDEIGFGATPPPTPQIMDGDGGMSPPTTA
jgi:hypothetical protein